MKDTRTLTVLSLLIGKRAATRLSSRPLSELLVAADVPDDVRARLSACIELVRLTTLDDMRRGPVLSNPSTVRDHLLLHYRGVEREKFAVLFLDNRHRLIALEEIFQGTIDGATVHPREVVKRALEAQRRRSDPRAQPSERSCGAQSGRRADHGDASGTRWRWSTYACWTISWWAARP